MAQWHKVSCKLLKIPGEWNFSKIPVNIYVSEYLKKFLACFYYGVKKDTMGLTVAKSVGLWG
jgi:hypothetical protein